MEFAYPANAWWTPALAALVALGVLALVRRGRAFRRLGPIQAAMSCGRIAASARFGLRSLALVLLGFALLGPCWGEQELPTPPARGRDLLIVLDVSRSMLAEDASPNRLECARAGLQDLVRALERRGGFRVGLVAFADRPALLCPLTTDLRHLHDELNNACLLSVRLREHAAAAGSGSELNLALERTLRALPKLDVGPVDERIVDVLVVSDGGDETEASLQAVASSFAERQVAVHCVGVGNAERAATIPLTLPSGQRGPLLHEGSPVETRLQEAPLRYLTTRTGGLYLGGANGAPPFAPLLTELTSKPQRQLGNDARLTVPIHRFVWFLLPAVVLLLIENLVVARPRKASAARSIQATSWLRRIVPPPQATSADARSLVSKA